MLAFHSVQSINLILSIASSKKGLQTQRLNSFEQFSFPKSFKIQRDFKLKALTNIFPQCAPLKNAKSSLISELVSFCFPHTKTCLRLNSSSPNKIENKAK
jgi:hypothetical protein